MNWVKSPDFAAGHSQHRERGPVGTNSEICPTTCSNRRPPTEPVPLSPAFQYVGLSMGETTNVPANAKLVLITLIMVPELPTSTSRWQTSPCRTSATPSMPAVSGLNLVAVGYSLGLATSVLYLGALGDRHGRKMMLILGTALAIPASLLAALAPSIDILFFARVFGGVAAGMAYPTTLAIITAL